jgi:hypothetical protein
VINNNDNFPGRLALLPDRLNGRDQFSPTRLGISADYDRNIKKPNFHYAFLLFI